MTDGTGFIAAAYILTGLLLGGYALGLARRARQAREAAARRPEEPAGVPGGGPENGPGARVE